MPLGPERIKFHDGGVVPDLYADVTVGADLPNTTVVLYIGTGGGDVTVEFHGGSTATFKNVVNTQEITGRFKQVTAVTATVADMLAGYIIRT